MALQEFAALDVAVYEVVCEEVQELGRHLGGGCGGDGDCVRGLGGAGLGAGV